MPGKAVPIEKLHKNYEGKVFKTCKHCGSRVRLERTVCPACGRNPDEEPPKREKPRKARKPRAKKPGACDFCWKKGKRLTTCGVCGEPIHERCQRIHTLAKHTS